jgi:NADH dehydrogenase FAD-containing subunit
LEEDLLALSLLVRTCRKSFCVDAAILIVSVAVFSASGEIASQHPGKKITIVHSGEHILNNASVQLIEKARKKVEKRLAAMGVELKVGVKVTNLPAVQGGDGFLHDANPNRVSYNLSDGSSITADMVIVCTGATRRSGNLVAAVNGANQVTVQPDLHVTGLPKVFCIGDANDVKETKMAYFAGKQARRPSRTSTPRCRQCRVEWAVGCRHVCISSCKCRRID